MIGSYLAQTIHHKAASGTDGYGQSTFDAAVQIPGRWVEKRRIVRNKDGREVISEISVTLAGDSAVEAGDQLSIDGEFYVDVITTSSAPDLGGEPITKRAFC